MMVLVVEGTVHKFVVSTRGSLASSTCGPLRDITSHHACTPATYVSLSARQMLVKTGLLVLWLPVLLDKGARAVWVGAGDQPGSRPSGIDQLHPTS